jgi:hypothetical protein
MNEDDLQYEPDTLRSSGRTQTWTTHKDEAQIR